MVGENMNPFDMTIQFRVIFFPGATGKVGEIAQEFNARRAMVVMDPGFQKTGLQAPLLESLDRQTMVVSIFNEVEPNPTTGDVEDGLILAKEFSPDVMIALGGGSALDTAKAINLLRTYGGCLTDFRAGLPGVNKLPPLIAIPTTAGTGSEVSPFVLISDHLSHAKIVIRAAQMIPDVAILDPNLTTTIPHQVTVNTGIDALVHGVEAMVAKGSPPFSQALAMEAVQIIYSSLPRVVERPEDVDQRGRMLVASNMAGMAFTYSYLGLAHSLANPLTQVGGLPHGLAVGMMLPYVILFNATQVKYEYARIARQILGNRTPIDPQGAAERLASTLKTFLVHLGFPENLKKAGISGDTIPGMAEEAMRQATVRSNPREPTLEEIEELYRKAYEGEGILG